MASSPYRILVLDGNQRSALAVTRSLGSINSLFIAAADSTTKCIAGSSRFCSLALTCPAPDSEPSAFLEWLENVIKQHDFHALFPTTEVTSQLLQMNASRFEGVIIPYTDYKQIMLLADKGQLHSKALDIGVNVPQAQIYQSAAEVDVDQYTSFPIVIKPCLSRLWLDDHWLNTTVQIAYSKEDLQKHLETSTWLQSHAFMLQEFIPGHGAGIFAIYNRGKSVAFFAHRRLREKPPRGGVSVLSESASLNPAQLEQAQRLLDNAQWHGVAMVEFRVDPQGKPWLMEVNTRFWGSLQLAIDAGVDFPKLLWQISTGETPCEQAPYKIGNRLRWLLGDLDSLYLVLKDKEFSSLEKIQRIVDFLIPRPFRTRHELNRWGDLKPALTEFRQYLKNLGL